MEHWRKSIATEVRRRAKRGPRVHLGMLALLLDENGTQSPVVVENVSRDGVLLQSERHLLINQVYSLVSIYEDPVSLEIVWSKGRFAGAKFREPIPYLG